MDSLEDLLIELRRRALHLVEPATEPVEPSRSLVRPGDIARAEELIEKYGWTHLRVPEPP